MELDTAILWGGGLGIGVGMLLLSAVVGLEARIGRARGNIESARGEDKGEKEKGRAEGRIRSIEKLLGNIEVLEVFSSSCSAFDGDLESAALEFEFWRRRIDEVSRIATFEVDDAGKEIEKLRGRVKRFWEAIFAVREDKGRWLDYELQRGALQDDLVQIKASLVNILLLKVGGIAARAEALPRAAALQTAQLSHVC